MAVSVSGRGYRREAKRVDRVLRVPISRILLPTQSERVLDLWRSDETELCVDGPVGCTKTVQVMLKILRLHELYPKFQSLVVRAEAKTLHTTIIPQLFTKIFRYPVKSKKNPFSLYGGENRAAHLEFDNGGRMTFGGMDDSGKILGSEYDLIFYNQAEREKYQRNWETLIGRGLEGRAGHWPHSEYGYSRPRFQIIADANPSAPTHWLKARESAEQIRFISFLHEDNPLYYYNGAWTERGLRTRAELERRYTGYMRDRMVYGIWRAAEGIVYTMFSPEVEVDMLGGKKKLPYHVRYVHRHDIPKDWHWFAAIDYGNVHAMCCQLWAMKPDRSRHIMYKEIYRTKLTPKRFIPMIQDMCDEVGVIPKTIFTDHNASHNQDLREAGFHVTEAEKEILNGIELLKDWLSKEYDSPRLLHPEPAMVYHKNSLFHPPDPELFGRPQSTVEEYPLYSYKEEDDRKGDETDEKPIKRWDEGMDTSRYYIKGVMSFRVPSIISASANFRQV